MAWKVVLILDEVYSTRDLGMLVHQMPVWAVTTVERRTAAASIRQSAGDLWAPEPAFTLFSPGSGTDKEETCRDVLGTVLEHHPGTAFLDLIGISASGKLLESLQAAGFLPAEGKSHEGLPFRKPIENLGSVKDLTLNAQNWRAADDLYASFLEAVGAPAWHGRNFDALQDSIVTGQINQVEVPYRIRIQNYARMSRAARLVADSFVHLIQRFEREGDQTKTRSYFNKFLERLTYRCWSQNADAKQSSFATTEVYQSDLMIGTCRELLALYLGSAGTLQ